MKFSSEGQRYKCFVAANLPQENTVSIYDINDKNGKKRFISYEKSLTEQAKVQISSDFKTCVLTDVDQKFIIEDKDGYYSQKELPQLEGLCVWFVCEAPWEESGFYFIASKEYSSHLSLYHSHQKKEIVRFGRGVEPGIIKIHDLKIQLSTLDENSKIEDEIDQSSLVKTVRMLGMRDDEFLMDKSVFTEVSV